MKWIFLIFLLCLVAAGFGLFFYIRNKARNLSRKMFGTDSLIDGYNNQKRMLSEEPKSVSGMTRIYLPLIQADFPEFNYEEFRAKSENMLVSAFQAISEGDLSLLVNASDELKKSVKLIIDDNQNQRCIETYKNIIVHRTEISGYIKQHGTCVITLQSAVGYYHYVEKDGKILIGSKDLKEQCKYNTDIIYIQDTDKLVSDSQTAFTGTICPNCGAPVSSLGSKYCEYCGSDVKVVNINVWSINKYTKI